MGIISDIKTFRAWRNGVRKYATPTDTSVPSRRRVNSWLPHWLRGDYTLKNSELLFSAITRLSNSLSSMPVQLYKDSRPTKSDLGNLIRFEPNPNMTSSTFFKTLEACRCTSGNCYALKVFDSSLKLVRLDVLDPSKVQVVLDRDTRELWYKIDPGSSDSYYVHNYYVLHIPFISTNGFTGINPVTVLHDTLGYGDDIKEFNVRQLAQGINAKIVLEAPANLGTEQKSEMIDSFMETYKETAGDILLLESGVTAKSLNLSPIDSKLFEVEKITRSKVALVYNIPPHLLGDYSESTLKSQEQIMLEFLTMTMLPIITAYEQELNRKLLTKGERRLGYHFKFNMDAILRVDAATQADVNQRALRSGWKTPDEIRSEYNLPPYPSGIGKHALASQDLATLEYTVKVKPKVLASGKVEVDGTPTEPVAEDE